MELYPKTGFVLMIALLAIFATSTNADETTAMVGSASGSGSDVVATTAADESETVASEEVASTTAVPENADSTTVTVAEKQVDASTTSVITATSTASTKADAQNDDGKNVDNTVATTLKVTTTSGGSVFRVSFAAGLLTVFSSLLLV